MPPSQIIGNTALAFARVWHKVDAKDRTLGKLASRIAITLMGKHKPVYDPSADCGDYVIVTNARSIRTTGRKAEQKMYYAHTQYPGGLKEMPFLRLQAKKPDEIIRHAVSGMLPKNKLRDRRLERLLIFADDNVPDAIRANALAHLDAGETRAVEPGPHVGGWAQVGGRRGTEGGRRWPKASFGRA